MKQATGYLAGRLAYRLGIAGSQQGLRRSRWLLLRNARMLGQRSRPLAFAGRCVLRSSLLKERLALVVVRRIALNGFSVVRGESTGLRKIARMFFSRMGGIGGTSRMKVTAAHRSAA